jgi:hypothetical protein
MAGELVLQLGVGTNYCKLTKAPVNRCSVILLAQESLLPPASLL